jgi:2-polyprenyl-3-methyl-5-hydroxy-6-metoxy-1,4-benzoquinol methylase
LVKENKYDDPDFFAKYAEMPRSVGGLGSDGEWPAFRGLLPELDGKRVLNLGCGFGWHCRYARDKGAASVVGVDLSEKMLERAKADTDDPAIEYRLCTIEDRRKLEHAIYEGLWKCPPEDKRASWRELGRVGNRLNL